MSTVELTEPVLTEREVTPEDLGRLLDQLCLEPGYSLSTDRAYVDFDGERVWAHLDRMRLPSHVPGFNALQQARVSAFLARLRAERAAEWEAATPEQRERIEAERRRFRDLPDPAGWQMDLVLERQGRL